MPNQTIAEEVMDVIAVTQNIDREKISLDSSFASLGVDSLEGIEIVMELEDKYGIEITNEAARSIKTVRDAVERLEEGLADHKDEKGSNDEA